MSMSKTRSPRNDEHCPVNGDAAAEFQALNDLCLESSDSATPVSSEWFQQTYDELRGIARSMLRNRGSRTEGPESASLVHAVYLKMCEDGFFTNVVNRVHFFGAVTRAMKQVLVDRSRHRNATKRGGKATRLQIDNVIDQLEDRIGHSVVEVNDALEKLAATHPQAALVLQCRVFGQMTTLETAQQLVLSPTTVTTYYRFAQSRLQILLGDIGQHAR